MNILNHLVIQLLCYSFILSQTPGKNTKNNNKPSAVKNTTSAQKPQSTNTRSSHSSGNTAQKQQSVSTRPSSNPQTNTAQKQQSQTVATQSSPSSAGNKGNTAQQPQPATQRPASPNKPKDNSTAPILAFTINGVGKDQKYTVNQKGNMGQIDAITRETEVKGNNNKQTATVNQTLDKYSSTGFQGKTTITGSAFNNAVNKTISAKLSDQSFSAAYEVARINGFKNRETLTVNQKSSGKNNLAKATLDGTVNSGASIVNNVNQTGGRNNDNEILFKQYAKNGSKITNNLNQSSAFGNDVENTGVIALVQNGNIVRNNGKNVKASDFNVDVVIDKQSFNNTVINQFKGLKTGIVSYGKGNFAINVNTNDPNWAQKAKEFEDRVAGLQRNRGALKTDLKTSTGKQVGITTVDANGTVSEQKAIITKADPIPVKPPPIDTKVNFEPPPSRPAPPKPVQGRWNWREVVKPDHPLPSPTDIKEEANKPKTRWNTVPSHQTLKEQSDSPPRPKQRWEM